MKYVIIALLALSLLVVGCSSDTEPVGTNDDELQLPPPPPPPPPVGGTGDTGVTGGVVAIDDVQDPLEGDLEDSMDDINLDDW